MCEFLRISRRIFRDDGQPHLERVGKFAVLRGQRKVSSKSRHPEDIAGTSGWKLYQFPVTLKNNTDFLNVELGLGKATTGKVVFDDIRLELE